jgi:hypothetical protein
MDIDEGTVHMYGHQPVNIYSTQTDKLIGILVCSVRGCGNDVATLASNNGLSPCSEIPSPYTQRLQTRQQTDSRKLYSCDVFW